MIILHIVMSMQMDIDCLMHQEIEMSVNNGVWEYIGNGLVLCLLMVWINMHLILNRVMLAFLNKVDIFIEYLYYKSLRDCFGDEYEGQSDLDRTKEGDLVVAIFLLKICRLFTDDIWMNMEYLHVD